MNEVAVPQETRAVPLEQTHTTLGASLIERDGWRLPNSYGDVSGEYAFVREGAGVIDLSSRGRFEVTGSETVQFLNGMITNDVKTLEDGAWMPAAFPSVQGRLVAMVRVMRTGDVYTIDTEALTSASVLKLLSRFTMAGDFRVTDKTSETVELSVQGPCSVEIIRELFGEGAADTNRGRIFRVENSKGDILVIRASHTGEEGYDLIVPVERAEEIWNSLVALKAAPVGFEAFETLRIEAGEPRFGVDMTENHVVLETGLDDAVSFAKGCYIGQEIIARIHWRGHVAKRLSGLVLEQGEARRDDRILSVDGKEIGKVTSAVFSPRLGKGIALGYVKYDYLPAGTAVQIAREDGEELVAIVTELPFIKETGMPDEKGGDGA